MTTTDPSLPLIRWGVAGPGRAAARFAQGLTAVPGAALTSVWGRTLEKAEAFANRFDTPFVAPSLEALLAAEIDAVYVATHPDTHAEICCKGLAAGKHVLCEKPAAMNERQLLEVIVTARRHGRLFMEAMKPPFFRSTGVCASSFWLIPSAPSAMSAPGIAMRRWRPTTPCTFRRWPGAALWASVRMRHFWLWTGWGR